MPSFVFDSKKKSMVQEFLELYEKVPGVLHIEYGEHIKNNIIVFIDSELLENKFPYDQFQFEDFAITIYDVRRVKDDAYLFFLSFKKNNNEKMMEIFGEALILCDRMLKLSSKQNLLLPQHILN